MKPFAHDIQDDSFSLTGALHHLMTSSGHSVNQDDLHAALGLSLMICASTDAPMDRWSSLARDAFLPHACSLFGISVRDLHPPEAARGLDQAQAYEQHFLASYLPHIERALENGQSVLAWQGWSETPCGKNCHGQWGIVTQRCSEGIGLAGIAFSGLSSETDTPMATIALSHAPVQVYVIETNEPATPDDEALVRLALAHAKRAWSPMIRDRFDVLVGVAAVQRWQEQVTAGQDSWDTSIKVVKSWQAGCASFLRFLQLHQVEMPSDYVMQIADIARAVEGLQTSIQAVLSSPIEDRHHQSTQGDIQWPEIIVAVKNLHHALHSC